MDEVAGMYPVGGVKMMNTTELADVSGRHCRLLRPVRDHEGRTRFSEQPTILRQIRNLEQR